MTEPVFTIINGWLKVEDNVATHADVVRVPSPFFNQRPVNQAVSLVVVHNISVPAGNFDPLGVDKMFTGTIDPQAEPELAAFSCFEVSAHCLITRCGQVRQYVSFDDRAWHAGVSEYADRKGCNDFSVGIELSGTDDLPYTEAQYQALAEVTQSLLHYFPSLRCAEDERNDPLLTNNVPALTCSQSQWFEVTGHEHIAPHRKTDPGPAFDWQYYLAKTESIFS